jgi:Protein of unknown function (DUF2637)
VTAPGRAAPAAGDRAIRRLAALAVVTVAALAAAVSYAHIYRLAAAHGQSGPAARMLPLSVDGLIGAASLVLLHEARNGRASPLLARCMLGLGVAATLAANIAYGLPWGPLGAALSAWPAVAFVGSAEMITHLVRTARPAAAPATAPETRQPQRPPAPRTARAPVTAHDAERAFTRELAAGALPSQRAISARMHVGHARARQLRAHLAQLAASG